MAPRGTRVVEVTLPGTCRGLVLGYIVGLSIMLLWPRQPAVNVLVVGTSPSTPTAVVAAPATATTAARGSPAVAAASSAPAVTALPSRPMATVAACVGGLLSLRLHANGLSVKRGVLEPLQPDVFVAGTLNATRDEMADGAAWARRVERALGTISALAPFAASEVLPQPTVGELASELRRSGYWELYERQVSAAGSGRLRPEDSDPRLWLPTMLSPALGNPSANTLREFHYQSRCYAMMVDRERRARRGAAYDRVIFTRLEFEWLAPHPPLSLLDPARVWVPAGEDNGGLNDRHWLSNRRDADVLMRRWESLLDGSALAALHGGASAERVTPKFVSSEIFMLAHATRHALSFGRFPTLCYLACCEDSYRDRHGNPIESKHDGALGEAGEAADLQAGAKACFQPHCNVKRCPHARPLPSLDVPRGSCGFKYDDEGSAAVINAELLARPGASLAVGAGPPARVEIAVPLGGGRPAGRFYFCFRCHQSGPTLTRESNRTGGCLLQAHPYEAHHLRQAVRHNHLCRVYEPRAMRDLCASFSRAGDKPDYRGATYAEQYFPWWCRGLPAL